MKFQSEEDPELLVVSFNNGQLVVFGFMES